MCPGQDEDKRGIPFIGRSGELLRKHLALVGINMDDDCIRTNAVACYKDIDPTPIEILCCKQNLLRDIEEVKPKLIICFGDVAIKAVAEILKTVVKSKSAVSAVHGRVFPYHKLSCWVGCSYHPSLDRKSVV